MPGNDADAVAALVAAGVLIEEGGQFRTSRRWQGAMARAARTLQEVGAPYDPRLPIVSALLDVFGTEHPERQLIDEVRVLLQIEGSTLPSALARP